MPNCTTGSIQLLPMRRHNESIAPVQSPPGVSLSATCRIAMPTEAALLIDGEKRLVAWFPLSAFDEPTLQKLRRGEITVELERQELDGTRAITFLDAQKRAVFRDRIRIPDAR